MKKSLENEGNRIREKMETVFHFFVWIKVLEWKRRRKTKEKVMNLTVRFGKPEKKGRARLLLYSIPEQKWEPAKKNIYDHWHHPSLLRRPGPVLYRRPALLHFSTIFTNIWSWIFFSPVSSLHFIFSFIFSVIFYNLISEDGRKLWSGRNGMKKVRVSVFFSTLKMRWEFGMDERDGPLYFIGINCNTHFGKIKRSWETGSSCLSCLVSALKQMV